MAEVPDWAVGLTPEEVRLRTCEGVEQQKARWSEVNHLTGILNVERKKNGFSRRIEMEWRNKRRAAS